MNTPKLVRELQAMLRTDCEAQHNRWGVARVMFQETSSDGLLTRVILAGSSLQDFCSSRGSRWLDSSSSSGSAFSFLLFCKKEDDSSAMKGLHSRSNILRWRLMLWLSNNRIRLFLGLCLVLGALLLIARAGRVSSIMGWHPYRSNLLSPRQRFTVLINTWRRPEILKKSVDQYSSCSNVDAIRVVWSEMDRPSESLLSALRQSVQSGSRKLPYKVEFHVDLHEEDNLNTRFKPIEGLKTDAVFSIDDDVVVPCETLRFAFSVWLSAPDSMVGFVPRMHWVSSKKHDRSEPYYTYGGWWSVWWTGTYSMVLTKAAFFHRKYLELYTNQMPASFRDHVTSERNCEDIAMSFLVANATGAPPIWVKGKIYEIGSTGISSLKGHSRHRTRCLNKFLNMYGYMPLVASTTKAVNARSQWFW